MSAGGFGSNPIAGGLVRRWPFLRNAVRLLYPPMPVLNIIPDETLRRIRAAIFPPGGTVLNIGAGMVGAPGGSRAGARADAVIRQAARVPKLNGYINVEMPFLKGFHAGRHDYKRYTGEGLRRRLSLFREAATAVSAGFFCALVPLLRDLASWWTRDPLSFALLRFTFGWTFAPLRFFDYLVPASRVALRLASKVYLLGQEPVTSRT